MASIDNIHIDSDVPMDEFLLGGSTKEKLEGATTVRKRKRSRFN